MVEERLERRLAAILAADIAGYSALMGADEVRTVQDLKSHQSVVLPMIAEFRGRVIDTAGDGILAEFGSAVQAVDCAIAIQKSVDARNAEIEEHRRLKFRIGINLGDVVYDDTRIYGDGINIAARLEAIAQPSEICISEDVYRQVRGKLEADFEDCGEQKLKNISHPVRVYRIASLLRPARSTGPVSETTLALPDKPSIAVLPFQNMSGDAEQEYFADGMVEDIITALSRFAQLFVVARNSTFTYKGKAVEIKAVGRELGVRYVLEGSVRKSGNRLRITGQLIDALSGMHLWADRFDGQIEDVFDLQDEMTARVVGAISPKLEQAEIERALKKPSHDLRAYDYHLRGLAKVYQDDEAAITEALHLFRQAIATEPTFGAAYGMAAWCYVRRKAFGWVTDAATEAQEASTIIERGKVVGRDDAVALCFCGHALGFVLHDIDGAIALVDDALRLNVNLAAAWYCSGWVRVFAGDNDTAIEHLKAAMRLNPLDPLKYRAHGASAFAHFNAGRYSEAIASGMQSLREQPNYAPSLRAVIASKILLGDEQDAKKYMDRLKQVDPSLRLSNLREQTPFRNTDDFDRYRSALQRAGLPN